MSLNVAIQTPWIATVENFRRFNLCLTGDIQLCGCVTQRLSGEKPYHLHGKGALVCQTIASLVKRQMTWSSGIPNTLTLLLLILRRTGRHLRLTTPEFRWLDLGTWRYEVDSLCYLPVGLPPVERKLVRLSQFDETLSQRPRKSFISGQWSKTTTNSPYRFVRDTDRKEVQR